jgi:methionyl-tRNA synthetase
MKMGKSLGNTLEPKDLVERFGADAVRYFFLREVEFGNDGDYSEERFINIVNAHLANTIGISTQVSSFL